jgi:hypothetical protein
MIISTSKQYIFVHIHKAAGTSVHFALDDTLQWNDISIGSTPFGEQIQKPYFRRFNLQKHSSAQDIRQIVGDSIWSNFFTFTFVRHPFKRAVSLYTYIRDMVRRQGIKYYFRHLPLARFQKNFFTWPITKAFFETKSFSTFIRHPSVQGSAGARQQCRSLVDESGSVIVDFVGKVERIEEDFRAVAEKIGLPATQLKRKNESKFEKSQPLVLKEGDYEYMYDMYKEDFDAFGYDPNLRLQ